MSTFDIVTASAGQTVVVDFTLLNVGSSTTLSGMSTNAHTANDTRGAAVTVAAGGVVLEDTNTVVDDAVVEVTSAVPTDLNYAAVFPGLIVGTQANVDLPIESFGFAGLRSPTADKGATLLPVRPPISPSRLRPVPIRAHPPLTYGHWMKQRASGSSKAWQPATPQFPRSSIAPPSATSPPTTWIDR